MSINLNEITEEYARLPFELWNAFLEKRPPGHVLEPFNTQVSAFHFPLKGKGQFNLGSNSYTVLPGKIIHGCPDKWLTAQVDKDIPLEFFTLYYQYEGANEGYMHSLMNWRSA